MTNRVDNSETGVGLSDGANAQPPDDAVAEQAITTLEGWRPSIVGGIGVPIDRLIAAYRAERLRCSYLSKMNEDNSWKHYVNILRGVADKEALAEFQIAHLTARVKEEVERLTAEVERLQARHTERGFSITRLLAEVERLTAEVERLTALVEIAYVLAGGNLAKNPEDGLLNEITFRAVEIDDLEDNVERLTARVKELEREPVVTCGCSIRLHKMVLHRRQSGGAMVFECSACDNRITVERQAPDATELETSSEGVEKEK